MKNVSVGGINILLVKYTAEMFRPLAARRFSETEREKRNSNIW